MLKLNIFIKVGYVVIISEACDFFREGYDVVIMIEIKYFHQRLWLWSYLKFNNFLER